MGLQTLLLKGAKVRCLICTRLLCDCGFVADMLAKHLPASVPDAIKTESKGEAINIKKEAESAPGLQVIEVEEGESKEDEAEKVEVNEEAKVKQEKEKTLLANIKGKDLLQAVRDNPVLEFLPDNYGGRAIPVRCRTCKQGKGKDFDLCSLDSSLVVRGVCFVPSDCC